MNGNETPSVRIAGRTLGAGQPPYVVAEMSGNHNGDLSRALRILEAAHAAGADAVKLQTYTADTITIDCDRPDFVLTSGTWAGYKLYDLYREGSTPWAWHPALFERGRQLGLTVFSTPFDESAVDFLEQLGAPAYKIASFELLDLPLIRKVASTGKPLIMSTGMASVGEIDEAVRCAREAGASQLVLLHCTSAYPSPASEARLRRIPNLAETFGVPVGLSDHTMGTDVAAAAVALGAALIEKHFTLRRADGGIDSTFSLEPEELANLVRSSRTVWSALGTVSYGPSPSELASVQFRRSIYAVEDISEGAELDARNVRVIRPGYGLKPKYLPQVLGRRAASRIARGTPIDWKLLR